MRRFGGGVKTKLQPVMEFNLRQQRWEFFGDYEDRWLPKRAGFFWVPEIKAWCTADRRRAVKLIAYADEESRKQLLFYFAEPVADGQK